jgi:hypothetical protein
MKTVLLALLYLLSSSEDVRHCQQRSPGAFTFQIQYIAYTFSLTGSFNWLGLRTFPAIVSLPVASLLNVYVWGNEDRSLSNTTEHLNSSTHFRFMNQSAEHIPCNSSLPAAMILNVWGNEKRSLSNTTEHLNSSFLISSCLNTGCFKPFLEQWCRIGTLPNGVERTGKRLYFGVLRLTNRSKLLPFVPVG